jgi:hypothetical protein
MNTKRIFLAFVLAGVLATATMAVSAQQKETAAQQAACSANTLKGSYGYHGVGTIFPNTFGVPEGTYISIGRATFDGEGKFTWTSSDFPGTLMTGTYTVTADCIANLVFKFPDGSSAPPAPFIIVDQGKEIFAGAREPVSAMLWTYKRQ